MADPSNVDLSWGKTQQTNLGGEGVFGLSVPSHPHSPLSTATQAVAEDRAPEQRPTMDEQVVPNPGCVTSTDIDYTDIDYVMFPGCHVTIPQDEKLRKMAHTSRSEFPLFVAVMSEANVSSSNYYVYIPLGLVEPFKEQIKLEAPDKNVYIKLEAPDKNIYSVGASKHTHDKIVLESGWDHFLASLHIQEKDALVFRSKEKSHLEVCILDRSGLEKSFSRSVMENSCSSAHEISDDDSVEILEPPPPEIIELSSSDGDDIVSERTGESCSPRNRVTRGCAKSHKMTSASSPYSRSGYKAHELHDRACSAPLPNNLGGRWQPSYILPLGPPLHEQTKKKIEEKVQELGSQYPIFVKELTSVCIDLSESRVCTMPFCTEYANAYLPDAKRKTVVLQLEDKQRQWETMMSTRRDKSRVLYKGWREFAEQNGLKEDDICLFQLASRSTAAIVMTVHIFRKSEIEP